MEICKIKTHSLIAPVVADLSIDCVLNHRIAAGISYAREVNHMVADHTIVARSLDSTVASCPSREELKSLATVMVPLEPIRTCNYRRLYDLHPCMSSNILEL